MYSVVNTSIYFFFSHWFSLEVQGQNDEYFTFDFFWTLSCCVNANIFCNYSFIFFFWKCFTYWIAAYLVHSIVEFENLFNYNSFLFAKDNLFSYLTWEFFVLVAIFTEVMINFKNLQHILIPHCKKKFS